MTASSSPLVQRRRLRAELRRARLDAGLTQEIVAEEMDWSLSKIIRIETGFVGVSRNDLIALLRLYSVNDPQRVAHLMALSKATRQQAWYSEYRELVPPIYFQYIEYETSASVIRTYESLVIPGLLQTEQYATKIMHLYRIDLEPDIVRARAEIRMKRQRFLMDRENPPQLFFVVDEAAIRRLLGDEETSQGQLDHLINIAKKPGVTIEVVPFSVGLHSGMDENFTLLEFCDPKDDDILYLESAREAIFSQDDAEEIRIYRDLFTHVRNISLGPDHSLEYLIDSKKTYLRRSILPPLRA